MARIDPHDNSGLLSVTPMEMLKARARGCRGRCLAMAFVVLAMAISAASLPAMPRAEKHETRHQIENLEEAWRNAVLKGNIPAMDALLADDYMAISPTGILQSKEQGPSQLRPGGGFLYFIYLSARRV